MKSVTALVPMRHDSERVPGKNYRLLADKPLYAYILETLLSCPGVSRILVNTDSPVIKQGIQERYASILVIDRPERLLGGEVPMNDIIAHDIDVIEGEYFLQTHSTNPLLQANTISSGIQTYFEKVPEFDSLFGVTRLQTRLWDHQGKPLNHDPKELIRTQDLNPVYEENSCIYLFSKESFQISKNRIGTHPYLFEINENEALDIDTEDQFRLAEFLI
jgi:CMP-N-acetylneuraminic acid synthetase